MVLRPAYTAEAKRPASLVATRAAVDSGQGYAEFITDTDVSASPDHSYYAGRSPECETEGTFTCHHPGCVGVEGFGVYFTSTEQFISHWNTFHVAIAVGYTCPETGCPHFSPAGPDSLDHFLHHLQTRHSTV